MAQNRQKLPTRFVDRLLQFNELAEDVLNSSYVNESKQKKIGITLSWQENKETKELDFSHKKVRHDEDITKSLILSLRFFIQDNEPTSIRQMAALYGEMPIDDSYKKVFDDIRKIFNDFLDEPATTLLDDRPTRREIYETIIYGMYAHRNPTKKAKLTTWKTGSIEWDMAYNAFELTLHDFIDLIRWIRNINKTVLEDYS